MHFLRDLVNHGFSQIYELAFDCEESDAGFGSEKATGTYLAKKGDQFFQLNAEGHARFGFNAKRSFSVTAEKQITADEYASLSQGKELIDTPGRVKVIETEMTFLKRRYQLEHQLNDIQHKCPECGSIMMWRSGKYGPFWSCLKYPVCMRTRHFSPQEKLIYQEMSGEGQFATSDLSPGL